MAAMDQEEKAIALENKIRGNSTQEDSSEDPPDKKMRLQSIFRQLNWDANDKNTFQIMD